VSTLIVSQYQRRKRRFNDLDFKVPNPTVTAMIGRVGLASVSRRFGPRGFVLPAIVLWLAIFTIPHDRAAAQLNVQSPQAQSPQAEPQVLPPGPQPPSPQPQPSTAPQPSPSAQASPPPVQEEGFFDTLGKWWDKSAAEWDSGMKKLKSQIDESNERNAKAAADATRDAVTATKDATDALIKFPTTRIIEGKERCLLAPNGSPDCNAAAEKICKGKGFTSGKSANIESARKCSARALLTRNEADCVNETIVTRAACQ
jgi:hypothetical protein